jgi:hypothetical protein
MQGNSGSLDPAEKASKRPDRSLSDVLMASILSNVLMVSMLCSEYDCQPSKEHGTSPRILGFETSTWRTGHESRKPTTKKAHGVSRGRVEKANRSLPEYRQLLLKIQQRQQGNLKICRGLV